MTILSIKSYFLNFLMLWLVFKAILKKTLLKNLMLLLLYIYNILIYTKNLD